MKHFALTILAALISLAASAQYASVTTQAGTLEVRGSRIFCNGEKLTKDQAAALFSDLGGTDRSSDYLRYRSAYKAGVGMSVGGASLAVAGGAAFCISSVVALVTVPIIGASGQEIPKGLEVAMAASLGSTIVGTAVMLAGIPTACIYQSRIKKMVRPASSGIGIAMNF